MFCIKTHAMWLGLYGSWVDSWVHAATYKTFDEAQAVAVGLRLGGSDPQIVRVA